MRKTVFTLIALLSLVVLGACAPALNGVSAGTPIPSKLGLEVVELAPGQTLYVDAIDYAPEYFGYDLSETGRLLNGLTNATKGASTTRGVTQDFSMVEADMPDGWNTNLERAYLRRDVLDSTTTYKTDSFYRWQNVNYSYRDHLNFTFAITAPMNAIEGSEIISVKLKRGGKVEDILLFVKVVKQPVS